MPSTLVAFMITLARISIARRAAAVSVVKYGLPVPAAKITTRPFSRCRIARRRMNGSATARISIADMHARDDAVLLERVLQGQGVDHRRQHAHVVAAGAIHAARAGGQAPEDIAAANHDGRLDTEVLDVFDVPGDLGGDGRVDAVLLLAHQGFARELQEDAFVGGVGHGREL